MNGTLYGVPTHYASSFVLCRQCLVSWEWWSAARWRLMTWWRTPRSSRGTGAWRRPRIKTKQSIDVTLVMRLRWDVRENGLTPPDAKAFAIAVHNLCFSFCSGLLWKLSMPLQNTCEKLQFRCAIRKNMNNNLICQKNPKSPNIIRC